MMFLTLLLFLFISLSNGFEIPSFGRKFGAGLAAGLLTINAGHIINPSNPALGVLPVQAAETKSIFVGSYDDPNHPGCLRKITAEGKVITILGSDNPDGSKQWKLQAKEDYPGTIFVDFSPKGGPKDLLGVYDEVDGGIRWPDKNLWKKQ